MLSKNDIKPITFAIFISILILWFESPLILIKEIIVNFVLSINSFYSNGFYILLSTRNPSFSSEFVLEMIRISFIGSLFPTVLYINSMKLNRLRILNKTKTEIESIRKRVEILKESLKLEESKSNKNEIDLKNVALESSIEDSELRLAETEALLNKSQNGKSIKIYFNLINVLLILFFISFIFISSYYSLLSTKISLFERDLKIISLKLSESEIKQIEYDWATMKNKNDYNLIMNKIDEHIRESTK